MERSEPALVPEWLRGAGNVAGAGNSAQQFASPSNHAGVPSMVLLSMPTVVSIEVIVTRTVIERKIDPILVTSGIVVVLKG